MIENKNVKKDGEKIKFENELFDISANYDISHNFRGEKYNKVAKREEKDGRVIFTCTWTYKKDNEVEEEKSDYYVFKNNELVESNTWEDNPQIEEIPFNGLFKVSQNNISKDDNKVVVYRDDIPQARFEYKGEKLNRLAIKSMVKARPDGMSHEAMYYGLVTKKFEPSQGNYNETAYVLRDIRNDAAIDGFIEFGNIEVMKQNGLIKQNHPMVNEVELINSIGGERILTTIYDSDFKIIQRSAINPIGTIKVGDLFYTFKPDDTLCNYINNGSYLIKRGNDIIIQVSENEIKVGEELFQTKQQLEQQMPSSINEYLTKGIEELLQKGAITLNEDGVVHIYGTGDEFTYLIWDYQWNVKNIRTEVIYNPKDKSTLHKVYANGANDDNAELLGSIKYVNNKLIEAEIYTNNMAISNGYSLIEFPEGDRVNFTYDSQNNILIKEVYSNNNKIALFKYANDSLVRSVVVKDEIVDPCGCEFKREFDKYVYVSCKAVDEKSVNKDEMFFERLIGVGGDEAPLFDVEFENGEKTHNIKNTKVLRIKKRYLEGPISRITFNNPKIPKDSRILELSNRKSYKNVIVDFDSNTVIGVNDNGRVIDKFFIKEKSINASGNGGMIKLHNTFERTHNINGEKYTEMITVPNKNEIITEPERFTNNRYQSTDKKDNPQSIKTAQSTNGTVENKQVITCRIM